MPSNQPSNAPQGDAPQPHDDLTAAAVLGDDALDRPAGGGALGTAAPLGGTGAGRVGAATPNSPIDAAVPHDAGDAKAEAEARAQSVNGAPAEPGHTSR